MERYHTSTLYRNALPRILNPVQSTLCTAVSTGHLDICALAGHDRMGLRLLEFAPWGGTLTD